MPFYYFAEETRHDPLSNSLVTFTTIKKPIPITDFQLTQLSKETIADLVGMTPQINTLNVGDVYYLYNGKIEGIELSGIFLKLYKVINEYRGVELNSIVVREVIPDEINGGFIDAFEKSFITVGDVGILISRRQLPINSESLSISVFISIIMIYKICPVSCII